MAIRPAIRSPLVLLEKMTIHPAQALLQSLQALAELAKELAASTREGEWERAAILAGQLDSLFQPVVKQLADPPMLSMEQRQACRQTLQSVIDSHHESGQRIAPWLQDVRLLLNDMR